MSTSFKTVSLMAAMSVASVPSATRPAIAQSRSLNHYVHTAWRVSDLKIGGPVVALAQTHDGYLWLGTQAGLFRFDGVRARPWQPPVGTHLPSKHIGSLGVSRDGTLWIGTDKGLATWNNGRLTVRGDIPARRIYSIIEDSRGTVWFTLGTPGGVCAVRADSSRCDRIDRRGGTERVGTFAVFEDSRGAIWVGDGTGLWRWAPGRPEKNPFIRNSAGSIVEDERGNIVVATANEVVQLTADSIRPYGVVGGKLFAARLLRSRDRTLWIATRFTGVVHLESGRVERFGVDDGLSSDEVRGAAFEDSEGSVWLGTQGGLDRFRLAVTERVSAKQGLTSSHTSSVVATSDGSVWIGTAVGLNRWHDGSVTVFRVPEGSSHTSAGVPATIDRALQKGTLSGIENAIDAIGVDAAGHPWVSSPEGVAYFDHGQFVTVPPSVGRPLLIVPGDRGATWLDGPRDVREWLPDGEIRSLDIGRVASAFLFDARTHSVWLGFAGGGLSKFADGRLQASYDTTQGLVPGWVQHLRLDSDGAVWATTQSGVSRIDSAGHVRTLTTTTGLPCSQMDWSFAGDDGTLWLNGPCGLIRISASELSAWLRDAGHVVQSSVFGEYDGVFARREDARLFSIATQTADGRLWFVAGDGIEILDPRRLPVNDIPPTARVEEVTADGKTYRPDSMPGGRLELPARVRNLEIQYSASSLAIPELVRFRFKLEGQDPQWREVVNQRRVEYSNLRPGTYDFRLMASNNAGIWSRTATSVSILVPPAWNQTWWFFALVAVAIAASAGASAVAWQRRRNRLAIERTQARFDATLAERTRVARELHDTLLGDMAGVAMQLNAGAKRADISAPGSPAIVELLSSLSKQVQHSLAEARRAVTAMRTEPSVGSGPLHTQIAFAAAQIFAGSDIVARVTHTGSPNQSATDVTADIVTIATEAMINARRHAGCRTATIACRYSERTLLVSVRDDGRGFDLSEAAPAGHWGMVGMRERASAIGATLTVSSAPETGTEVLIEVPNGR